MMICYVLLITQPTTALFGSLRALIERARSSRPQRPALRVRCSKCTHVHDLDNDRTNGSRTSYTCALSFFRKLRIALSKPVLSNELFHALLHLHVGLGVNVRTPHVDEVLTENHRMLTALEAWVALGKADSCLRATAVLHRCPTSHRDS